MATELLTSQSDYDDLVRQILDKKRTSPYIVAIGRDEETEAEAKLDGREISLVGLSSNDFLFAFSYW